MKRRQFLKTMGKTGALGLISTTIGCSQKQQIETMHSFSDYEATIAIKGLKKTTTVMHIADSHISVIDENEKEFHGYSARMDKAYNPVPHYKTGKQTTPIDSFLELMDLAQNQNVDMMVLTGDIVNNPSKSSVRFVSGSVQKIGVPSIYVAGNHDWHYEGMQGSREKLRQTWIQNSLLPLYDGKNPLYSSQVINGINFVTIDNSTYQVNEEQLNFYKKQMARSIPVVLLMHIPLYLPKDAERDHVATFGDPHWGWDIDHSFELERRERWGKSGNSPSTIEFLDVVKKSTNLAAVLVGHTHRAKADKISETAVQYVTRKSADGGHRLFTFKAL